MIHLLVLKVILEIGWDVAFNQDPGPIYRAKIRKNKIQVYEMCGFKIENESKDLFQKTRNPLTEKMTLEKMILLIEKISVQKNLTPIGT